MRFLQDLKRQFAAFLPFLPLTVATGIVPLVVYLKIIPVPAQYRPFWPTAVVFDFFSFYKAQILIICAGVLLMIGLVLAWQGKFPRKPHIIYVPLMVYTVGLLASAIKSVHPTIALGGFFDRDEGVWVLISYIILFLSTYLLVSEVKQAWWILSAWLGSLVLISGVGLFQYFGLDLFQSAAGLRLILPAAARFIASQLEYAFPRFSIYSTLYNPNNVAAMFSLAFPFTAAIFVLSPTRHRHVIFGALSILFGAVLLGTHGRAAWVAVSLALILLAVVSFRQQTGGVRQRLALIGISLLTMYGVLNFVSRGSLARQAAQPLSDVGSIVENGLGSIEGSQPLPPSDSHQSLADSWIRRFGRIASGRGYIWIRSLQMAPDTMLLGHGSDTFALYFPNTDPYKAYSGQSDVFIDKPHSLFLQIWLNLGGLAALAFVAMLVIHAVQAYRILKDLHSLDEPSILSAALFIGWLAFIMASVFYDSSVSVSPVFWVVFGLSMAINMNLNQQIADHALLLKNPFRNYWPPCSSIQ